MEINLFNPLTSNHELFYIKTDENGNKFAYIGYTLPNENFHFEVVKCSIPEDDVK